MDTKKCKICKERLPLSFFHKKGLTPIGNQRYRTDCVNCKAKVDKTYNDTPETKAKKAAITEEIKRRNKQITIDYLKTHPCVDCGISDIRVLEFDHVIGTKIANISTMVARHVSVEVLIAEIEKCEIRCANCHRIKTAERGNWSILEYIN